MSVDPTLRIGSDTVDLNLPCDVAQALRKVQLRLVSGAIRETVRIDGEEVTFQRGNDTRLAALIKTYDAACARQSGGGRRGRFAKRFTFGG